MVVLFGGCISLVKIVVKILLTVLILRSHIPAACEADDGLNVKSYAEIQFSILSSISSRAFFSYRQARLKYIP